MWARYDIWDPYVVKMTHKTRDRWAVVDMTNNTPVYVSNWMHEASDYMNTLRGNYKLMPYNGYRANGVQ